jgi:hypothetical protein
VQDFGTTAIQISDMIERIWELISTDLRMTLPMMEEKLRISKKQFAES